MSRSQSFPIDAPALRSLLANRRLTARRLADASGLSACHVGRILRGDSDPGELALIRLRSGLCKLGLADLAERALPDTGELTATEPKGVANG